MAKKVKINGVTYDGVSTIGIPLADGNGDATYRDTSDANVTASDLAQGAIAYGANGKIEGNLEIFEPETHTITAKSETYTIPAGIHDAGGKVMIDAEEQAKIIPENILSTVQILGVHGSVTLVSVVQDSTTHGLRIS